MRCGKYGCASAIRHRVLKLTLLSLQMNEYLGKDSDIYLCTCSNGVLEDVLEEGIPSFAKDLIHERIQECGLPVAGNATCDGLYDDAVNVSSASCADEKSPVDKSSYSCKEQADFGKCSESWMDGYCLASCGKCESASASTSTDDDDDDIPVSGDCSDEKSPVDKSDYTCKEQADYGKCDESWMDGYCLLSCGQCVPAANVSSESATNDTKVELDEDDDSILDIPAAASVRNSTNTTKAVDDEGIPESANCTDEKSPADNSDYTCEEQANFGKCDDGWMDGYCLASCGKCEGPSTLEVVAASTNTLVNGTCIDEPPASEVDCEMSAENGDCSKEFMEGFCLASCGKCEEAPRGANTNQSR